MTGNVQLYLTDGGRIQHRMAAHLGGMGGGVKRGLTLRPTDSKR